VFVFTLISPTKMNPFWYELELEFALPILATGTPLRSWRARVSEDALIFLAWLAPRGSGCGTGVGVSARGVPGAHSMKFRKN